jgi:hypothetical protein
LVAEKANALRKLLVERTNVAPGASKVLCVTIHEQTLSSPNAPAQQLAHAGLTWKLAEPSFALPVLHPHIIEPSPGPVKRDPDPAPGVRPLVAGGSCRGWLQQQNEERPAAPTASGTMKSLTEYLTFNIPSKMAYVNITPQVAEAVRKSGVMEGLVLCNSLHITASVFVNDDEAGLHHDFGVWLERLDRSTPTRPTTTLTARVRTMPTPT